jgi:membrane protein implicated in regulation of membrane protease activity
MRRHWPLGPGPGITVWFATLVVGMVLRRATGAGTAWPFVVVAAVTLAVLLLGWRAIAGWRRRRYAAQGVSGGSEPPRAAG